MAMALPLLIKNRAMGMGVYLRKCVENAGFAEETLRSERKKKGVKTKWRLRNQPITRKTRLINKCWQSLEGVGLDGFDGWRGGGSSLCTAIG